jgi:tetratricopeptide (TPR) repeat protein
MADEASAGFSAIAPYLQHPLVLVGFVLLIVVGFFRAFLRSDKVATASQTASGRLLLAIARYGFVLALAVILLGFALVFYREYRGEQAREDKERAVAAAIAGVEGRYKARVGELEGQRQLDQATIGSLNDAVRALAGNAGSPQPTIGVDAALAELARGETAAAERIFAEVLARRSAEGATANREAAEAARHLGALAYLHDTDKALAAYRRAAELEPADAWTWIFISRLEAQAGRLAKAEEAARRAGEAALAAGSERDAAVADHELGDVRVAQGDLTGAKRAFQAYHDAAAKLAASDPGNAGWQRDLSVSWDRLGDVRQAQGDLAGALAAYEAGRAIRERLAASDLGNAGWQRDLSVSWNNRHYGANSPRAGSRLTA